MIKDLPTHIRIREARKERGLSQTQLGEMIGVSQSVISDIESGKQSPTVRWLILLAVAMDLSPRDLVPRGTDP